MKGVHMPDGHLAPAASAGLGSTPDAGGATGADLPVERTIRRLVGVYDADGTLRGEVAYWVGARLGRAHCSLCDITHGSVREKSSWKTCRAGLPVEFDTFHRNDQPDDVRVALEGVTPAVVADTTDGILLLLGPEELEACGGDPDALMAAIEQAVDGERLGWPQQA
jgi:hypothetical protein